MRYNKLFYGALLCSLTCLFAGPSSLELSLLAYFVGYPAFFIVLFCLKGQRLRVIFSVVFGFLYFLIQMRWLGGAIYHGKLIVLAYVAISLLFASGYAIFGLFLPHKAKELKAGRIFQLSFLFAFIEYARLFFMCGFPFHTIGLILSAHYTSIQLVSIVGGYGLSAIVLLYALYAAKSVLTKNVRHVLWVGALPFVLGGVFYYLPKEKSLAGEGINLAVLQTGMRVEEKLALVGYEGDHYTKARQLNRIVTKLEEIDGYDLIVLPEIVVSGSARLKRYTKEELDECLPSAFALFFSEEEEYSHLDVFKELSIYLNTDLILGLIDRDKNSMFYLSRGEELHRYDKMRLVPFGEYIPFSYLHRFFKGVNRAAQFTPGEGKPFMGDRWSILPSICYDEGFPDDFLSLGQRMPFFHVNLTNDAWFIDSSLGESHFHLARVRSVENGMYTVRACNTGVSALVSPKGDVKKRINEKNKEGLLSFETMNCSFTPYTFSTPFSKLGNPWLFFLAGVVSLMFFLYSRKDMSVNSITSR